MSELSGTLDGVGLPPIVRFLAVIKKSGTLHLTHHDWYGDVFFVDGRVSGARFGSQTGLAALDALMEALPGADFAFDSQAGEPGEPSIRLNPEALHIHLDDLTRRLEAGLRKFPAIDQVPSLVVHDEATEDRDEPLPLDRGTLQTLLGVNGRRSVRQIVAQRGTFDALWHLASLVEVGLIEFREGNRVLSAPDAAEQYELAPEALPRADELVAQPAPAPFLPPRLSPEPQNEVLPRCPKLGFEDDAANSFTRPTRLHRCFATGTALPLSLDQQGELCLTGQFETCPRLASSHPDDAPRIVRLPIVNRAPSTEREPTVVHEPTRLRAANGTGHDEAAPRPTPLRARLERAAAAAAAIGGRAVAEPPTAPSIEMLRAPRPAEGPPVSRSTTVAQPGERRFAGVPVAAIAGLAVVLAVIATVAFLLLPQMDTLFGDDSVDTTALPNSSRVAAGTPVSVVTGKSNATAVVPVSDPAVASQSQSQATPVAQSQATPAARPTQVPIQPTVAPAAASSMVLEEHFQNNVAGWPSSSLGPARVTEGTYRIATRLAGQFVAIGAPIASVPADVNVSAGFRKLAGPAGGGYGIIVHDQGPGPRDGASQEGRYYVLEIGDKGEIGIWRRDADHWVDLLSWQHSDAVKPGTAPNELTVKAVGSTLTMIVNGTQVATRTDSTLSGGQVGLFIGGDGNQVLVDHYLVQAS